MKCILLLPVLVLLQLTGDTRQMVEAVAIRYERQVEAPPAAGTEDGSLPDMAPWIEMGTRYGMLTATTILLPMGMEALNQTAQG